MMNQLSFIPSDEPEDDNPVISAVEQICKTAAVDCAQILIDMATGKKETNKELRLACCDVIGIAYGTKFRAGGRPRTRTDSNSGESAYMKLLKSMQENNNEAKF